MEPKKLSTKIIIKQWNSLPQDVVGTTYMCGLQKATHCGDKRNLHEPVVLNRDAQISIYFKKRYRVLWNDTREVSFGLI